LASKIAPQAALQPAQCCWPKRRWNTRNFAGTGAILLASVAPQQALQQALRLYWRRRRCFLLRRAAFVLTQKALFFLLYSLFG
jgi:hypothetical protein